MDPISAGLKGIDIRGGEQVKMVTKPWGWEKWLAHGKPEFPYAFKMIHIKAPHRTSLQFHRYKQESIYLLSGKARLHYSDAAIDAERFAKGGYSPAETEAIVAGLKTRPFNPGETLHVMPCHLHRMEALEDITMLETSTTELDDVFRVQDDAKRAHGHIPGEHK